MKRSVFGWLCFAVAGLVALAAVPVSANAQNAVLRGTVRSEAGDPVGGANVYIVELAVQAATNEAGRYVITVPGDRVRGQQVALRVRAIGYRPGSRPVTIIAGDQSMDFTLAQDINRLDEIVVTGVLEGTERAKVPFTVSRVDVATDVPTPPTDPVRMLAGRVPGATIMSNSGRPGNTPDVILRGPTSINASGRGQGPLYIVDGIVISGTLSEINPSDIENIEVVKGAAASSLYGARAGNGVIQITTRSGRRAQEGTTFTARTEMGASDIERDFGIARNHNWVTDATNTRYCVTVSGAPMCSRTVDWATEAARINNNPGTSAFSPASLYWDPGAGTSGTGLRNNFLARRFPGRMYNAVEQTVLAQPFTNSSIDMSGRFGSTNVFASLGATQQGGAIRFLEGYERYSGRVNADHRIGDNWSVSLRSYFARSGEDGTGFDNASGGAFFRLTRIPGNSNTLARDTLGRLYVRPNIASGGDQNDNPIYRLQYLSDVVNFSRFIGGTTVRYTPASWADLEANFSIDYQGRSREYFYEKNTRTTTATRQVWHPVNNPSPPEWGYKFSQSSTTMGLNSSVNLTLRRQVGRDLATRWSFRYLYEQQDFDNRSGDSDSLSAVGVPTLGNAAGRQNRGISSSKTETRQIGLFAGANLEYRERYIFEFLVRRDGSSLFGEDARWATFGRASLAYRISQEPWWFGGSFLSDAKLRWSRGTAGGRPAFDAQYETFGVGGGVITFRVLGNSQLKPEITTEYEWGGEFELFRRLGVSVTRAVAETRDQILLVRAPAEAGFTQRWQNAGTMEGRTWELSLNVPLLTRRDLSWSWRFIYDRTRTEITRLDVPEFFIGASSQATGDLFRIAQGEPYGRFYGRVFVRDCMQLPPAFQTQTECGGATSNFQRNSDGYIVWTGGLSPGEGITRNGFMAQNPSATAPWGVVNNWGMPILVRDTLCITTPSSTCASAHLPIGNALPDWTFAISQNFSWRRLTVYGLLQGVMGRDIWNQGRHWAHLDFLARELDQEGRSVEEAKPIGYYYRSGPPDHPNGIGGFYEALRPSTHQTEDASFAKLRELTVTYNLGPVGGVGNWTLGFTGRNLFTITNYRGFDPEVGQSGSTASSSTVNAVDAFTFPNTRQFVVSLSTRF